MKKLILILTIILFINLTIVSAMDIKFFYSNGCPHCENIKPLVNKLINYFPEHNWQLYETSIPENQKLFQEYGFQGVPSFVFIDGNNLVKFSGADQQRLICETQRMSTKDCVTYSANNCRSAGWFE